MAKSARKIVIELQPVRVKIARAAGQAKRSIARGEMRLKKAIKAGDREESARQRKRVAKAKVALAKLKQANQLMIDACCNQRYNCDPN